MRVLLADDDPFYRLPLRKALESWGYEVLIASDGTEALNILQGVDPPHLAILDWMMPGMDGINICSRVRKLKECAYTYIILITARGQKKDVIAGLDAQADDYLVKPFALQELRARLQSGLRIVNLQAALTLKQRELSHQATHDSLTGIWNRSAVMDILERETESARKSKKPLCLALADIDNFKLVNDTYGHAAGDAVLIEVVRRIQSALRHFDAIGRYGGEEFVIVMPDVGRQRSLLIAERLRLQVAENPYEVMGNQISVTLSIGVAEDTGTGSIGLLLRSADEALYRAKGRGRNCVEAASAVLMNERRLNQRQSI
jgi:two-component system cell cycle response regulator